MDAWDDDFREPTEDERSARRVLAIAIAFSNARRPLTTPELHREYYPHMSDMTFRKTFLRDRERLASAGLLLQNGPTVDGFASWKVDETSSFVRENPLSAQDALVLDLMLLPLASDPSFPYSRDLRHALNKIDRSFDGSSCAAIPPEARKRNNSISRLEDCMTARHAARVQYTRADGQTTRRILAPYGFFFLNESTYMVAARLDGDEADVDTPHTYNLDRVSSVTELAKTTYRLPLDFDVRDYIKLPFQMGPARYTATFRMPNEDVVTEPVYDTDKAVSWALAKGARPLEPPSLVEAWVDALQGVAKGVDHEQA
ncbi:MAG: WYL domain-containing protein [Atopobiaceae bacterium]|nr:WYL domain-containing protein [Atopobiaceae bacterium]